jgi:hypothetical protein
LGRYFFINEYCAHYLPLVAHICSTKITSVSNWVKTFGFYATKISLLPNGVNLPQLVCGLVGDLALLEPEEDFGLQ